LGPSSGPITNFLVAGIFGIIGTLYFILFGKDLKIMEKIDSNLKIIE